MPDLGAALHVARNDIRLLRRDRGTIFWSFVGPFIFMMFFGILFRGSGPPAPTVVLLHDEDRSETLANALTVLLRDGGVDVRRSSPDSTAWTAARYRLVIAAGAADSLAAGRPPHLVLHSPNQDPTPREQTLRAVLGRALLSSFLGLSPADVRASLDTTAVRDRIQFEPQVRLAERTLGVSVPSTGFQHTVPAYLVMFVFMTVLTSGVEVLIGERRSGQLRRALVAGLTPAALVAGKIASRFLFAWIQIAVMLGVGILAFRVRFGAHPEALLLALLGLALAATGIGILFATFFRNPDKAAGLGSLITMAMAALGGCWWPLEIVPAWMRKLALALPTGWGFDALNRVMALDQGIPDIASHLAVLFGLAVLTLPLAARRMRWHH